jgi:hypothetical protein
MATLSVQEIVKRASQNQSVSVETGLMDEVQPGVFEPVRLEVTYRDPCDESVLAQYHVNKAEINEDTAGLKLWERCGVEPAELCTPEVHAGLPTPLKTNLTQALLERLGNERFFRQHQQLIAEATALAISKQQMPGSSTSPEGSKSTSTGSKKK